MDIAIVIVLVVIAAVFFILELFLIPGVSLAGIAGTIFFGVALYYAYARIGSTAGHLTLAGGVVILTVGIVIFLRSKTLERMSLQAEIDGIIDPLKDLELKVGDEGTTVSRLAPMGKIRINNHTLEAKTNGEFIDQDKKIVVLEVYKTNVLVGLAE